MFSREQKELRIQLQKSEDQKSMLLDKVSMLQKQLKESERILRKVDNSLKSSENKRLTLSKQLEEKIQETSDKDKKLRDRLCGSPRLYAKNDPIPQENSDSDLLKDVNSILCSILDSFKYPDQLQNLTLRDDRQLKEACSQLNKYQRLSTYVFGFVNSIAKIISLKVTCEKYIQISSILERPFDEANKRQSLGTTLHETSKEKTNTSVLDEKRKDSGRKVSKKKQSNFLNYKKQVTNSTRNLGPSSTNSLTSYFYSNRSVNEASAGDDSEGTMHFDKARNELNYPKPNLRKNVYESMPKKLISERKGSTPANFSVLTDNYTKTEDSIAAKYGSQMVGEAPKQYNTSRNSGLKVPESSFKYSSNKVSKQPKLPVSKSVKNIHENYAPKPVFYPGPRGMKSPQSGVNVISRNVNFKNPTSTRNLAFNALKNSTSNLTGKE